MSEENYVRYCANCKLVYRPDPRTHVDPHEYCPRCGFKLVDAARIEKGNEVKCSV